MFNILKFFGMTKEEVLKLCENGSEITRVEGTYTACRKFGNKPPFDSMTTKKEVRDKIKELQENYEKRSTAKLKAYLNKESIIDFEGREKVEKLIKYGLDRHYFNSDEIFEEVKSYVEKKFREQYESCFNHFLKDLDNL